MNISVLGRLPIALKQLDTRFHFIINVQYIPSLTVDNILSPRAS